jgi:thiol:disulfide interchange protein
MRGHRFDLVSSCSNAPKRSLLALLLCATGLLAPAQGQFATPARPNKHLYSETADARADITAAVAQARTQHKRIILDFGGNWCGDCQVLDIYFHQPPNLALLNQKFILVHVNIGQYDHNIELTKKYQVPINKGVPALAVLDSQGKLLFSQRNKEFENMSKVTPESVTEFLNHWKS